MRRTSSLPSGVFKTLDKNVEEALTGPVADVFLSHMVAPTDAAKADEPAAPAPVEKNRVAEHEIEAFLQTYSNGEKVEVPLVTKGLRAERMWVLTDLATNGTGRARELATRELRDSVRRFATTDEFDVSMLHDLIEAIEDREQNESLSVLLQVLLASARKAVRSIEEQS